MSLRTTRDFYKPLSDFLKQHRIYLKAVAMIVLVLVLLYFIVFVFLSATTFVCDLIKDNLNANFSNPKHICNSLQLII